MILDFNEKGFLKFKQGRFKLRDFGLFEKKNSIADNKNNTNNYRKNINNNKDGFDVGGRRGGGVGSGRGGRCGWRRRRNLILDVNEI